MLTHGQQITHGEKLVAVAGRWAEAKGFDPKKVMYVKTFAAAVSAVQDEGPSMLTFDEMRELTEELAKVESEPEALARKMAREFYDIPIAVTVLDGEVYGAYIGNWEPYDLKYAPAVVAQAIEMGLFNTTTPGEVNGKPVTWWRNKRA